MFTIRAYITPIFTFYQVLLGW